MACHRTCAACTLLAHRVYTKHALHAHGKVRPESVKFVLKWGYAAHLTLLCLVDDAFTRLWVLGSTLLT